VPTTKIPPSIVAKEKPLEGGSQFKPGRYACLLSELVGRIMIRRYESPRWRVTPSASTRPTSYALGSHHR
jgi:hypothetical protein